MNSNNINNSNADKKDNIENDDTEPTGAGGEILNRSKLSGVIIVDKPPDWTSHDVVAKLRGALHVKRIGHGGTLDPMATGVLPVFVGRATGAVSFFESTDKEYIAGLRLGIVTDTQDITGNVTDSFDVNVGIQELRSMIPRFIGPQKQIPPMYSAVKIGGKKLYQLARRGIDIERAPKDITIHEIEILDSTNANAGIFNVADSGMPDNTIANIPDITNSELHDNTNACIPDVTDSGMPDNTNTSISDVTISSIPDIHNVSGAISSSAESLPPLSSPHDYLLRISCSKGTYIRTLCNDIGAALGCGAVMSSLRRTRAGGFDLRNAHTLNAILNAASSCDINIKNSFLLPVDSLFLEYSAITLDEETAIKCRNGRPCRFSGSSDGIYRFYGPHGEFLLLAELENGLSKIIKTFFEV